MIELAARIHRNYLAARELVARITPGGSAVEHEPWLTMEGPARYRGARTAILREQPGPATPEAVGWVLDWAGDDGQLVVRDTDTWALRMVTSAGFMAGASEEVAMALPLEGLEFDDDVTRPVVAESPEDLRQYARLVSEENGLAPRTSIAIATAMAREGGVQLHLLKVEDVVVARSMSFTWDGVAGLYNVYVPPAFRRRGFGRAISVAALRHGQAAGAELAGLQANAEGLPLYRGLGFQALYHYLSLTKAG